MCSSGQVRGTFIAINTQSYTEAVTCRCTVTVEQPGFITVATASTPSIDDCKSHVVLHIQTERLIQCTKNPTYFFQATENESGNISFSTAYNSHGKTKYSLQLCGKWPRAPFLQFVKFFLRYGRTCVLYTILWKMASISSVCFSSVTLEQI